MSGFQETPGYVEVEDNDIQLFVAGLFGDQGPEYVPGPNLTVDEDVTDSGNTPTTTLRPGRVFVRDSSDGIGYPADTKADEGSTTRRNQPASIETLTASLSVNTYEDGTATFNVDGGPDIVVTFAHTDNTAAEFAAALNADKHFAGQLIATVTNTTKVTVKTLGAGKNKTLRARCSLAGIYAVDGSFAKGSDAKYFVSVGFVRMLNSKGEARNAQVKTARAAWFDSSKLLGSTPEAEAVLQRQGSFFD